MTNEEGIQIIIHTLSNDLVIV